MNNQLHCGQVGVGWVVLVLALLCRAEKQIEDSSERGAQLPVLPVLGTVARLGGGILGLADQLGEYSSMQLWKCVTIP